MSQRPVLAILSRTSVILPSMVIQGNGNDNTRLKCKRVCAVGYPWCSLCMVCCFYKEFISLRNFCVRSNLCGDPIIGFLRKMPLTPEQTTGMFCLPDLLFLISACFVLRYAPDLVPTGFPCPCVLIEQPRCSQKGEVTLSVCWWFNDCSESFV